MVKTLSPSILRRRRRQSDVKGAGHKNISEEKEREDRGRHFDLSDYLQRQQHRRRERGRERKMRRGFSPEHPTSNALGAGCFFKNLKRRINSSGREGRRNAAFKSPLSTKALLLDVGSLAWELGHRALHRHTPSQDLLSELRAEEKI